MTSGCANVKYFVDNSPGYADDTLLDLPTSQQAEQCSGQLLLNEEDTVLLFIYFHQEVMEFTSLSIV